MADLYHDGNRRWQDRFDTRRLADRIEQRIIKDTLDDNSRAFIERMDMFFLVLAAGLVAHGLAGLHEDELASVAEHGNSRMIRGLGRS